MKPVDLIIMPRPAWLKRWIRWRAGLLRQGPGRRAEPDPRDEFPHGAPGSPGGSEQHPRIGLYQAHAGWRPGDRHHDARKQVETDPEVAERYPLMREVAKFIAHPQIRNRGTFGGAIAHADPAGQLPASRS